MRIEDSLVSKDLVVVISTLAVKSRLSADGCHRKCTQMPLEERRQTPGTEKQKTIKQDMEECPRVRSYTDMSLS